MYQRKDELSLGYYCVYRLRYNWHSKKIMLKLYFKNSLAIQAEMCGVFHGNSTNLRLINVSHVIYSAYTINPNKHIFYTRIAIPTKIYRALRQWRRYLVTRMIADGVYDTCIASIHRLEETATFEPVCWYIR